MLFVDTGVWYAALDRSDRSHAAAVALLGSHDDLMTSDYILVEGWRLIAHRLGHAVAERFWDGLRRGAARVEPVSAADRASAWTIGQLYPDQNFSLVDRTSFALMERQNVRRVATFDSDFTVYRFGPDRTGSFIPEQLPDS